MRSVVNILCILFFLGVYSCSDDNIKDQVNLKAFSLDNELKEEVRQAQYVFKHLYLPVEMSNMFENAGEDYNPALLNNPENVEKIIFSNEIALAMGMYGVDLGYVRLYEQWNMANSYLQSLKDLSVKIGISDDVYLQLSDYLDHPVYNKDTLEYIANRIYVVIDYNLRQIGRNKVSELIILGGWIETMRLAIDIYNGRKNEIVLQKIVEQQNSLNSVISLLEMIEDDELIMNYLEEANELNTLLRELHVAFERYKTNRNDQFSYDIITNYLAKIEKIIKRMQDYAE